MAQFDPVERVLERQRRWASTRGLVVDGASRTEALEDNLFQPLNPATLQEYAQGAGNELEGDIRSLRSSAALACNVFDYWRGRDLSAIAEACGADPRVTEVSFERQFPTGLRGIPPHLDVVLEGNGALPTAIESKFTEIYGPDHGTFRPSYFERADLWEGLASCLDLAKEVRDGRAGFERLGVAQLIKHALGLRRAYGPKGFQLLYLWYEVPGDMATQHRAEIERFEERVGSEFAFAALSYDEVFGRLGPCASEHPAYMQYLADRYFGSEAGRP